MNTKPVPIIITLIAALISCVVSILEHVEFSVFVNRLLIVVVIFLVMGTVVKIVIDYSFKTLGESNSIDDDYDLSEDGIDNIDIPDGQNKTGSGEV